MAQPPAPCDAHPDYFEFWVNLDFYAATTCPFTDQLGTALFALLFFGGIGMSFWMFSDSASLPLVLGLVFGSTALTLIPAQALNLTVIVVLLAVVAGGYLLIHRAKER